MDYKSEIEELRKKLDNYSFDSSSYDDLYAKAYESLNKALSEREAVIDDTLKADKRQAAMQNTLQTRSLSEQLAARGLAKSGESGLMRLNQAISLNNALDKLTAQARAGQAELKAAHNDSIAELETNLATLKDSAAREDKDKLYERLEHLEKLALDEKQYNMDYSLKLKAYEAASNSGGDNSGDDSSGNGSTAGGGHGSTAGDGNGADGGNASLDGTYNLYEPNITAKQMADALWATDGYASQGLMYSNKGQRSVYVAAAMLIGTNFFSEEYVRDVCSYLQARGLKMGIDYETLGKTNVKRVLIKYKEYYSSLYNYGISNGYDRREVKLYAEYNSRKEAYAMMESLDLTERDCTILKDLIGPVFF